MAVKVPKAWPGETVVVMATGPSLTAADVDACRGKARVIAVNNAFTLAPWADVLYSSDRYWWPHHKGVPSFTGPKYGIGSTVGKNNPFHRYPDIQVLRNTGYSGLELDPRGLRNGKNSGYAAVNLAVHFGVSRILLLGFDMGIKRGAVHFFGNHVGMSNPTDSLFESFRRHFKTIVEPLREAGVSVFNCTPGSSLSCFPMADLRSALAGQAVAA